MMPLTCVRVGFAAVAASLVFASIAAARATESAPAALTLSEALHLLETETPDVRAARLQIADAEAERLAAQLYQNPTLATDVGNLPIGRTNPPGLSAGQTVVSAVRIDQPLVLWGKRRLRIDAANAGIAAAQAQAQDTLRLLRAALKDAFFRAVHDTQRLAFAVENQRRYQHTVELSERRFRSGDLSEADFRKIELEQLTYLTSAEDARRAVAESEQLLGRLVGRSERVAPFGPLDVPNVEIGDADLLETALDNRPDFAELQRQRERADLAVQLARRERYPDVTVGADYTNSQFTTSGDLRNSYGLGFSVPLPLLNQNQAAIAKADVAQRQTEAEIAKARLDIAQEVHDGAERYQSAQRLRAMFEQGYLERAKVVLNAAESSYRSGGASLIELLDAERTYTTTETDYLASVLAARTALTNLELALGKDLTD
jgi:outer membrane protein, heavy metal efflux system